MEWMFASKHSINKICKIHFRTLQIVHQKHFHTLAIEVYKFLMKTNPDFMWDFYTIKPIHYDLCTGEKLYLLMVNTEHYHLNSLIFAEACYRILSQLLLR